ncbi:ERCC4-like helicase [Methanocella conradii HZ254]|uniref:ERCC4-like helicase n=2 Tax=Methanocella TaxID=570266 RepID=H8I706_METCZ|nr:ERCC4-like helicase [Methanocella conradii HZ254]
MLATYITPQRYIAKSMPEFVSHPLLKPDTVSSRAYQLTLARNALEKSSLIVLPTGLGKTIIALLVMLERLEKGKALMLSPTKPLVEQHAAFLKRTLTIPEQVAVFTGSVAPSKRVDIWKGSRIIVSTPQVIENDLLTKRFDLKDVSLIVFDEAHRATGDYAYVYIAKKYVEQSANPLVLGITASPGSTPEKINEVKQNLFIERVEIKTEKDPDVAPYIYEKDVEWVRVNVPDKAAEIKILLDSLMDDRMDRLKALGVVRESRLTKKELLMLQEKLQADISRGGSPESYRAVSILAEIMKIEHAVDLIQTQGVVPLKKYFERLKDEAGSKGGSKATKRLMQDARLAGAMRIADTADEVNPKTEKVKEIVLEQIRENPSSRIIVFTNFRDTADFVSKELAKVEGIRPVRFVGQASKLNDKGLTQKRQVEILNAFRSGEFNTLIATSVAEEGLDIPSTDLVIFYEPVPSEIRTIQRRGRTGRNAVGRVVVLISKGTRDEGTYRVSQAKEKRMYRTMRDMKDGQRMEELLQNAQVAAPAEQRSLEEFEKPPERVEVYVDAREMRSAVVKNLEGMSVSLNVKTLEVGDYVLSDRVCVERKTADDFLDTLFGAGRSLFEQVIAMKHSYMRPILVIEGEGLYTKRRVSPAVIHGVLASIAVDYGVPIIFTADEAETASFLYSVARREQIERKRSVNPHAQKASHTLAERQEYLVSAISEVGPVIAKNLLRHFGSVKAIVNATEEELKQVDKVGEKTAKKIREVMDAEYRPRD